MGVGADVRVFPFPSPPTYHFFISERKILRERAIRFANMAWTMQVPQVHRQVLQQLRIVLHDGVERQVPAAAPAAAEAPKAEAAATPAAPAGM